MGYQEDVAAAKARYDEAVKAYKQAVKDAERLEKQARKDYDKNVKDAEKALNACEQNWTKPLSTFGDLKLFAARVANSTTSLSITEHVDARIDMSSNAYGSSDGRKKKASSKNGANDEPKLYITVTTPDGQIVAEGDASKEREAREFVAQVINQSKVAADAVASHEEEVRRLGQNVAEAKANTDTVEAAAAATQAAKEATGDCDEAQRLLDETRASGSEEEIAALNEKERKVKLIKMSGIGVAAAIALLIVLFSTHVICFHKWEDATCTEPQTCSVCGRTKGEALGHEWKQATCTEPETCDRCGETQGKALGHEVEKWETVKKASCTEKGKQKGVCTRCGEEQTRETDKKDHEFGEWKVTKEATCTEEGTRVCTCKNCGKEKTESIKKIDHTPGDWVVAKEPSVSSNGTVTPGERVRTCTACGAELDREEFTLDLTTGQRNALAKAASYLSFTAFSYSGLVEQLEFEGFSNEEATFAADHCGADWNEQAARKAQSYLDFMSFSRDGLIDQLMFEGFSYEQAEYGVTAVGY